MPGAWSGQALLRGIRAVQTALGLAGFAAADLRYEAMFEVMRLRQERVVAARVFVRSLRVVLLPEGASLEVGNGPIQPEPQALPDVEPTLDAQID